MADVGDDITNITMSLTFLTVIFSNCSQNFPTSSFQTSQFQILDSSNYVFQLAEAGAIDFSTSNFGFEVISVLNVNFDIFAELLVPESVLNFAHPLGDVMLLYACKSG